MRSARPVGRVFSPLDKELALLPSTFSPFIHQCIVRLGTLLPFEQAAERRRQGRLRRQAARVERAAQAAADETRPPTSKRLPPEPTRVVGGRPTKEHRWKRGYDQRRLARARARAKT